MDGPNLLSGLTWETRTQLQMPIYRLPWRGIFWALPVSWRNSGSSQCAALSCDEHVNERQSPNRR